MMKQLKKIGKNNIIIIVIKKKFNKKMSKINSPIPDLNCESKINVLMRKNGIRGIIVSISVIVFFIFIILISKWNEIRQEKIPFVWKKKVNLLLDECNNTINLANKESEPKKIYKYIIESNTIFKTIKKIIGKNKLDKNFEDNLIKIENQLNEMLKKNPS